MRLILAALALCFLCACQTTYVGHARTVRGILQQERFREAADEELERAAIYPAGDRILMLLNQASVLHDAGRFDESNACLLEVQVRLADFYRRSTGGQVARSAVNGTLGDYLAEDYERTAVHLVAIENYLALGKRDDARVEARRLLERLRVLADVKGHGRRYQRDGFAQWVSGLLLEESHEYDDSRLAFRKALIAFGENGLPKEARLQLCADATRAAGEAGVPFEDPGLCADAAEIALNPGEGELVLLHSAGLIPERGERRLSCGLVGGVTRCSTEQGPVLSAAPRLVTIAVPELRPVPAQIHRAALIIDGEKRAETVLVEDLQSIALQTLEDRLPEYQGEAAARALARLAASASAGIGASEAAKQAKASGKDAAWIGVAVGVVTQSALSFTEAADRRSWFSLPAAIGMARIPLPAGAHRVQVALLDASGQPVRTVDFGEVTIDAGIRTWLGVRSVK